MKIIDEKLKLDNKNSKTHMRYKFTLDREYEKLKINFKYEPSIVPKDIAKKVARKTADEYIPKDYSEYEMVYDIMADFRVLNLLMVSLSKDGEFIGSYHNENNDQEIEISKNGSSLGFNNTAIVKGEYIITISAININSDVNASLEVEAI